MTFNIDSLKKSEQVPLNLKMLFEKYGYKKYKVSNFEEYSLYMKYKSFLTSDKILSFTDLDGRLLALKPDITLSIIKNSTATSQICEKAYYTEAVYRDNKKSNSYKEISQMGLEYMGIINDYAQAEVVLLAKQALFNISPKFILELGHMGFATGILENVNISTADKSTLLGFISAKSSHEVAQFAKTLNLEQNVIDNLSVLCTLSGNFEDVVSRAKDICVNSKMQNALAELNNIYTAVKDENETKITLDLTLVNATEFYDGLLMNGYINGVSKSVLSGGRYDIMMKKLNKNCGAIGFAVYLDELERLKDDTQYDVDVLIISKTDDNANTLLKLVKELVEKSNKVLVQKQKPQNLKYKLMYEFNGKELEQC